MKNFLSIVAVATFALGLTACSADGLLGPDQETVFVSGDGSNQGVSGDGSNQGVSGDGSNQ